MSLLPLCVCIILHKHQRWGQSPPKEKKQWDSLWSFHRNSWNKASAQPASLSQETAIFFIVLSDGGRHETPSHNKPDSPCGWCLIGLCPTPLWCHLILWVWMMSRVRLGPTDADGVMKRKAVNMNNGAMKKSHNMALVCFFVLGN